MSKLKNVKTPALQQWRNNNGHDSKCGETGVQLLLKICKCVWREKGYYFLKGFDISNV